MANIPAPLVKEVDSLPVEVVARVLLDWDAKAEGSDYYRVRNTEAHCSIKASDNSWHAYRPTELHGNGAVSFLVKLHGYHFKDAVSELIRLKNTLEVEPISKEKLAPQHADIPINDPSALPVVVNYLRQRKISETLLNKFIHQGRLYGSRDDGYINAIVLDETKTFAIARGATGYFKANYGKSKIVSFDFGDDLKAYIFESFIDAWSYWELYQEQGTYLVTAGTANPIDKLQLDQYLDVVGCFDNDRKGQEYREMLQSIRPDATFQIPVLADFNEDLKAA